MASRNQPFVLADATPRSSKTTINIAGFHVYLYGVEELTPEQAKDTTVLFHVHGRTRTYKDAEAVAHELLFRLRDRGGTRKGLVVATFDNRNHGMRTVDNVAIHDWKSGNPRHGQDMLSTIDGIVLDIQTVQKYLPCYVEGIFAPTEFIITGLSLGGHVSWNVLAQESLPITKAIIIIGSPNLTNLLLDRLGEYSSTSEVPKGTKEWPPSLAQISQARDDSVSKISGKQILILNGLLDPLVPTKFTRPWVEKYAANNEVTFIEHEENGHWMSYQMMDTAVDWVWKALV